MADGSSSCGSRRTPVSSIMPSMLPFFLLCLSACVTTPASARLSEPLHRLSQHLPQSFRNRLQSAVEMADLEQQVEDHNAEWQAGAASAVEAMEHRRLICLPLDERFNPTMGNFAHNHVQTGDTMSLPRVFWSAIQASGAEVPWLFSVKRVPGVTAERVTEMADDRAYQQLDEVVGSPLDFRAPSNYIFLPWWMMRALGLQPMDVVDVRLVTTVPKGSMAYFRPHSARFIKEIARPSAVLETELRHYASLTKGTTIGFDYNNERFWFDVVELRSAPKGDKKPIVKVQDCDLATDFLPSRETLEEIRQKRLKKQQQQEEEEEE